MAYTPADFVPSSRDRVEGDALVSFLKTIDGEVLTPFSGHLPTLAGQRTSAHQMAMADLFKLPGDRRHVQQTLRSAYREAFASHRFAAVVLDEKDFVFMSELERDYHEAPAAFVTERDALRARTGAHLRPQFLYLPR